VTRPPRIVPGTGRDAGTGSVSGSGAGPAAGGGRLHVVRFAPAKLNLTLAVLGRRDDGYHSLHSVMVPLTLGDALTVSTAPAGAGQDSLRVSGLPVSPTPENLILRAIAATRTAVMESGPGAAPETPPLAARLTKRIPLAAGLGGGSSDAAAAMDAALAAWHGSLTESQAAAVAASLGSDVPFFLARGTALVTGRGEFVEPLPQIRGEPPAVLVVTPQIAISTAAVFAAFAGGARPRPAEGSARTGLDVSEALAAAMRAGLAASGLLKLAGALAGANDLLPASQSVAPQLRDFIAAMSSLLERPVGLSGSGPTLWVLYPSLPEARKAARLVRLGMLDGRLPRVGSGGAFVGAASLAVRPDDVPGDASGATEGPIPSRATHANHPRTVHNEVGASANRPGVPAAEPHAPKGDDSR
jgi:4-diphosphocytidyl-2-C-methyl-D-erythritol kinase